MISKGVLNDNPLFSVDLDVRDVVLEDGGDVDLGELVLAEHDQQARLPARAVAHDHKLLPDRSHPRSLFLGSLSHVAETQENFFIILCQFNTFLVKAALSLINHTRGFSIPEQTETHENSSITPGQFYNLLVHVKVA